MQDPPSFSLDITQIMSSDTNCVYEHEDIGSTENRSKKLHDPLVMVDDEKVKKDALSSSKAKIEKPLKRG